jgi:hypothetical protein
MVGSRTVTAVAGVVVSLLLSAALWWYFETFVFFLFVPFVPFLFRRHAPPTRDESGRTCPTCGFRTQSESYAYCPRDGTKLD